MADLAITDTAVIPGGSELKITAGEAIVAGTPIYKKAADKRAWKADANVSAATAECIGFATSNAAAGQTLNYQKDGDLTMNAVLTAGGIYILSATAGKVCPVADLASGSYVTTLGTAKSTTVLTLGIVVSGVQVP